MWASARGRGEPSTKRAYSFPTLLPPRIVLPAQLPSLPREPLLPLLPQPATEYSVVCWPDSLHCSQAEGLFLALQNGAPPLTLPHCSSARFVLYISSLIWQASFSRQVSDTLPGLWPFPAPGFQASTGRKRMMKVSWNSDGGSKIQGSQKKQVGRGEAEEVRAEQRMKSLSNNHIVVA